MVVIPMLLVSCGQRVDDTNPQTQQTATARMGTAFAGEKHLKNIRQLTFGGQNAEAYFSKDGGQLIFQSTRDSLQCDAIFQINTDGSNVRQLSSGRGTTTCAFIAPDGESIIYASTHLTDSVCPPRPDRSRGYTWALYPGFEIFKANRDGNNLVQLTNSPGYDAECVYSPQGDKILFTSVRSGDLDLFMMNPDGSNVEQLTNMPGYDGGAFFSADGAKICWRASRPTGDSLKEYQALLRDNLVRPTRLEIYIMDLNDRKPIQLTFNNASNFAPYFHPDGEKVIFASNVNDPKGRNFDLFLVTVDSKSIEQVTFNETFDAFPMFSYDGSKLVFASNRDGQTQGETNVFIADWVD